jgi:hypothetical protein
MNDSPHEIGSDRRGRLREIVRTEVEKAGALADSRRSLELIVETAVRLAEDSCTVEVIDEQGQAQSGETIQDLLNRLRIKHPTLFKPPPPEVAEFARVDSEEQGSRCSDASAEEPPSRFAAGRDWLEVGSTPQGGSDESALPARWWDERDHPRRYVKDGIGSDPSSKSEGALARLQPDGDTAAASFDDLSPVDLPHRSFRFSIFPVLSAVVGAVALLLLGYYATAGLPIDVGRAEPSQTAQTPVVEPDRTGAIAPPNLAALEATGPLRGVPDVLDTATLWVEGKIVHLYGVEWVRGAGNPDEFTHYLRGRVVVCTPVASASAHRCIVDGRDLSLVVLVNGGGRTTVDAPREFRAAEELAKSAKLGVWSKQ